MDVAKYRRPLRRPALPPEVRALMAIDRQIDRFADLVAEQPTPALVARLAAMRARRDHLAGTKKSRKVRRGRAE